MKILFFGTPSFAAVSLKALLEAGHNICGVVTQPDKPVGRKKVLTAPPVKEVALSAGIPVFQPETLKNEAFYPQLTELQPDCIVTVAYGKLFPAYLLEYPSMGCINVHGSLLPAYRGAAPIQWAVINGEKETGITVQKMVLAMDEGDILEQVRVPIPEDATAGDMFERLAEAGAELLLHVLGGLAQGNLQGVPQDHTLATYAPMLTNENTRIDWQKDAVTVANLVRGAWPSPGAYTFCADKRVRICACKPVENAPQGIPGQVVGYNKVQGFLVCCGDETAVAVTRLQEQGSREMTAVEFACGHAWQTMKFE
ncbi:MAG: methionyl-tRNA formyltransferase [Clostridia bacterium]|nr:methionyl-tRNA formyltransferase [Clostridia bacterium]